MKNNLVLLTSVAASLLAGCGGMGPYKNQSDAQLPAVLEAFTGKYAVVDTRGADAKGIKEIELALNSKDQGFANTFGDSGKLLAKIGLHKCKFANEAQTGNSGAPVESVENIITCDIISSSYQYATLYAAKVKSNYVVKDQAVMGGHEPLPVNAGYLIKIKLNPGTGILANASKK